MTLGDRTPVLVGAGQVTVRPDDDPLGPIELMAEAIRRAAADTGGKGVVEAAQSIGVVAELTRRYADPATLVATRLGIAAVETVVTTAGGNSCGALLNRTCDAVAAGHLDVAILTGGEAWRTSKRARRNGVDLPWATEPAEATPDRVVGSEMEMNHPVEQRLGIRTPTQLYPLFEDALRARLGRSPAEHACALGQLWSRFSQIAATNPFAWDPVVRTPEEIVTPAPANRMVATPYTKLLCSNEMVDQGAALIVCSVAAARRLGIPDERWVFPVASAEGAAPTVSERWDLSSSPMIAAVGRHLWALAGAGPGDVTHIDLYSCFPSAVEVQAAELGIDLGRDLTVTGGMRFAGGPWNNYPMHAMAALVERLRDDPSALGLCTFNGGVLTKQVASLFSATPPSSAFRWVSAQADVDTIQRRRVDPAPLGRGVVEAATVEHDRAGPVRAIVAALQPDGRRAWGIVSDPAEAAALAGTDLVGQPVHLDSGVARL